MSVTRQQHLLFTCTYIEKKTTVNMKVSGFCYDLHFQYCLPLQKISKIFPIRIKIIDESYSLYNVLHEEHCFSVVLSLIILITNIMLPMLNLHVHIQTMASMNSFLIKLITLIVIIIFICILPFSKNPDGSAWKIVCVCCELFSLIEFSQQHIHSIDPS
jgi:hypothetical protein